VTGDMEYKIEIESPTREGAEEYSVCDKITIETDHFYPK